MTPPTAREALAELARRLDALAPDATWLPPDSVAQLVREFAETIPGEAADTGPDPDNEQYVGIRGDRVTVMLHRGELTPAQAYRHAAWLIAMADLAGGLPLRTSLGQSGAYVLTPA